MGLRVEEHNDVCIKRLQRITKGLKCLPCMPGHGSVPSTEYGLLSTRLGVRSEHTWIWSQNQKIKKKLLLL